MYYEKKLVCMDKFGFCILVWVSRELVYNILYFYLNKDLYIMLLKYFIG